MADVNTNINDATINASDSIINALNNMQMSNDQVLRSINQSLRQLNENLRDANFSQTVMHDRYNSSRDNWRSGRDSRGRAWNSTSYDEDAIFDAGRMRRVGQSFHDQIDKFTDEFEKQIWQSLAGDPITKVLGESVKDFANTLVVSVEDLGKELGKKLGEQAGEAIKNSPFGAELSRELTNAKNKFTNAIDRGLNGFTKDGQHINGFGDILKNGGSFKDAITAFGQNSGIAQTLSTIGTAFQSEGVLGAASAIGEMGVSAALANPAITALAAGFVALTAVIKIGEHLLNKFKEALSPAIESAKNFAEKIKQAANRDQDMAAKKLDEYKKRIQKDNEAYIRAPFEVLKEAADEAYQVWDNLLKEINQTQGYDKADFQDLWSSYASRLKEEGLDSVVSSADIMTNLSKVLEAGMSGEIAEEFAYLATVLDNAIPTEEFFNYASTYASIAANAVKNGKSQSEAIKEANEQLEQFASNLLYSSRQLAGGFTTGLKDAASLFEASNKIATASHTGNAAEISGVLTAVSAIVGGIAPDLTDSIVSKITEAATGGNSSELVALRSLAGTGASNTAFLQAMAKDPQGVFIEMFTNLAQMQQMYSDNYMEVAESLSKTFGMSMDEMSRIDFGYLAQAVSAMDLNNASLSENLALLGSGESTPTADQLRMQQINKYMIDEGLSYVLDNEVARAIQEHMWDEQIAQQLMENTYSTELTGAGLEFLQGLQFSVDNIFTMLNPFGWMKKVEALVATTEESIALNADIKAMLERTNVGRFNPATLYNLTTGNTNLHLTKSYLELLGGNSAYGMVQTTHRLRSAANSITGLNQGLKTVFSDAVKGLASAAVMASRKISPSSASSQYSWATIGKSLTQQLFTTGNKALYNSGSAYEDINMSPQAIISSKAANTMQAYLDTMQSFVDEGKSYEEWVESATEYGIEDLGAALSDYGLNEVQTKGKFQEMEAVKAAMYQHERDMKEEKFWDDMIKWCEEDFPLYTETVYEYYEDILYREDLLITNTDVMIGELQESNKQLKEFYNQWIEYYVRHTAYHTDTLNAHEIEAIKTAEAGETGDAVFALAQALTDNLVNLQDPQVQTNALLSQILLVTEAIFQIENNTTTVSLPTALSSLGLGVTSVENQY